MGVLVFKIFNNLVPDYLHVFSKPTHHYGLRSHDQYALSVPKPRTNMCIQSLQYRGSKIWNSMLTELKEMNSLLSFKTHFKKHVFNTVENRLKFIFSIINLFIWFKITSNVEYYIIHVHVCTHLLCIIVVANFCYCSICTYLLCILVLIM